jgi:hypothetical protein
MPASPPPDGILVIGDSYTEARHVAQSERFSNQLGQQLRRRVYNAGHAGWSPLNALGYLRAELPRFRPATVVVQVSGNDLADVVAAKRARVELRGDRFEIVWPTRGGSSGIRETLSRSAFAGQMISSVAGLFGGKRDDEAGGEANCATPSSLAVSAMPWIFGELARTHRDVRIVYIPKLEYHGTCNDTCVVSRVVLERAAQRAGLRFVDPTAAMCARFAATRQPLNGFWNTIPGTGHLNADGHAVVAALLAETFE